MRTPWAVVPRLLGTWCGASYGAGIHRELQDKCSREAEIRNLPRELSNLPLVTQLIPNRRPCKSHPVLLRVTIAVMLYHDQRQLGGGKGLFLLTASYNSLS